MELTVYRQSSKTRPDGTVVYKGEDALPYVDGQLIMAADGLGGAAAIRHTKIRPELFEEDKTVDTLFHGVWDDLSDPVFADYVKKSFFELRAVKDIYSDNVNNIKKSGYFASRIVTAIVLREVRSNDRLSPDKLFGALEKEKNPAKREEFLKKLGGWFRSEIKEKLTAAAKNANIVYESAYTGLALLGTTLCAAIYRENKDSVDTVYITAGDSRPYLWNESEGLCQLIADQERDDGGMTNYIRADEGSDFTITCTYRSFPKPCVLLNASDGCFDSASFLSPMAFEKLLMETAVESAGTEEWTEKLTEFFLEHGRHDDSSTIAMKLFGFMDFSAFKTSAAKRLSVIQEQYLSKLEGLLDNDYIGDLQRQSLSKERRLAGMGRELRDNAAVRSFCEENVRDYAAKTARESLEAEAEELKEKSAKARRSVTREAASHLADLLPYVPEGTELPDSRSLEHIRTAGRHSQSYTDSYLKQLEQQKAAVTDTARQLEELLARVSDAGVPDSTDALSDVSFAELKSCEVAMAGLFGFLGSLRTGRNSTVRRLVQRRSEYESGNRKLAEEYPEAADKIAGLLIEGGISPEEAGLGGDDLQLLEAVVEAARSCDSKLETLEEDRVRETVEKCAGEYWDKNSAEIIGKILSGEGSFPEELAAEVRKAAESLEDGGELAELAKQQQQIFARYEEGYAKYMK